MSTFKLEITVCTCCYRPIELCSIAQKWIAQGVPAEWITEERLFPEEVNTDGNLGNHVAEVFAGTQLGH